MHILLSQLLKVINLENGQKQQSSLFMQLKILKKEQKLLIILEKLLQKNKQNFQKNMTTPNQYIFLI